MKIKIIFSMLLIMGFMQANAQQITGAEVQVTGLTCSMCSQATEKSLKTLDFILSVTPDLNKNVFVLTFKKDKKVNIDLLKKKVQDAGFSVGSLQADFNFEGAKVDEQGQAVVDGKIYRFENLKSKSLSAPVKAFVIDKDFISSTSFKERKTTIQSDAYTTGYGLVNGKKARVYHLSI